MEYDKDNLFAKILRKEIPSHVVFDNSHALAILDAFPIAPFHALLIPKAPDIDAAHLAPDDAAQALRHLPRLASMVKRASGAPAVKIVANCGAEAGQVIFHTHFHVVPRWGAANESLASGPALTAEVAKAQLAALAALDAPTPEPYAATLSMIDALADDLRRGELGPPRSVAAGAPPRQSTSTPADNKKSKPPAKPVSEAEAKAKKEEAKAKKEAAKAKKAAAPPAPAVAADRPIDFSWADVRVGVILDAKPHPDSSKLYVETIDLGEPSPRTVLSGLAEKMPLAKVTGARVVCICNLGSRKMGGIESQAMVLCASSAEGVLDFVVPPDGAAVGARVEVEGCSGEPEVAKKMGKKKAWESIMPELRTDAAGTATYRGTPLAVRGASCTSSIAGGVIS